jgi:putative redox protein
MTATDATARPWHQKHLLVRHEGAMRFVAVNPERLEAPMDSGDGGTGQRPTELVLAGLAGCTGMDVAALMVKKRQDVRRYAVEVTANQRQEYPQVFDRIDLVHVVEGGVDVAQVARCIELSAVKYCPISAMLSAGPTAIHHRYRIIDTRTEPPAESEGEVIVTGPFRPATVEPTAAI